MFILSTCLSGTSTIPFFFLTHLTASAALELEIRLELLLALADRGGPHRGR